MAGKDIIKMSQEEAKRLCVIQKALDGEIKQVKAAEILSLSDRRQVRRIVKRVRLEGNRGIVFTGWKPVPPAGASYCANGL